MGRVVDETGNRYGLLTVIRRNPENAEHKGATWICSCECGGERVAYGIGLRQGLIKSCGCLARERRIPRCACGYTGQKTRDWTPDWKCYRCSGGSPLDEPPKMTDEELLQKRAEHWRFYHRTAPTSASHDVMLFLGRLEQLGKELAEANARRADLRTALEWANEERDRLHKELASKHSTCPDCADYAARSARFAEQADRLQRERDEARAEVERLREDDKAALRRERDEACEAVVRAEQEAYRIKLEARAEVATAAKYCDELAETIRMHVARELELEAEVERVSKWRETWAEAYAMLESKVDTERAAAFRRGAEAMRLACREWCIAWENEGRDIADALADLAIPEER